MDFDYWEQLERPRTSFTVYATDYNHQQPQPQLMAQNFGNFHQNQQTRKFGPNGPNRTIHLDDQEELNSIRSIMMVGKNGRKPGQNGEEYEEEEEEDGMFADDYRPNQPPPMMTAHLMATRGPGLDGRTTKIVRVSRMASSQNASNGSSASSSSNANHFSPSSSFQNRQNVVIANRRPSSPIQSAHRSPPHHSNASSHSSYPPSVSTMSSTAFCHSPSAAGGGNGESVCAVCGDGHAKLHYSVLACYGCKGFFRRTLTGKYRYVCRFGNNCVVDKFQRNSCRCCRFQRCLDVGMDPKAVRPDRDLTGKQKVPRNRKRAMDEELINHMMRLKGDDWSRKIPLDAKMLLMQLLNIESKVAKGDESSLDNQTTNSANWSPPPESVSTPKSFTNSLDGFGTSDGPIKNVISLKDLFEQKPSNTRRTEMSYKPSRMARAEELPKIAHRGAIAAVDWVESLDELIEPTMPLDTQDKISLVKAGYAPLTIFNFSARTAQNTMNPDILCLCSYSYVPRKLPADFNGSNHLSNNLIDRTLNELVVPLRRLALREEEVVALKAIIILDPNAKCLSPEAQRGVSELRDRVQDMLFQVVKELHPTQNAASRFWQFTFAAAHNYGYKPPTLSGLMCENMQFCQVFGWTDPLLNELFEPSGDDANKGGGADQFAAFLDDSGTGGLMPISYSPPILSDSQHCLNPADISLHSNEQTSPSSLPRNLASSRLSVGSASTSSSSPPTYSPVSPATSSSMKPSNSTEKCEISTQTDEIAGNQFPIASSQNVPSEMGGYSFYTFDEHSNSNPLIYGHQDDDVTNFASQSPFPSSFFDHHHNGPITDDCASQLHHNDDLNPLNPLNHPTNSMEFSTATAAVDDDDESLLFDGPTGHHHHSTADDLFGLMQ